jgi:hypothetical protein
MKSTLKPILLLTAIILTAIPVVRGGTALSCAGIPRPARVVIVMLENRSYADLIGSPNAPYINSLAAQGAVMTNSFGIGHPSQPNYFYLWAGSNLGITNNACPVTFNNVPNLAANLINAGYSVASYSEDLPSPGSSVCFVDTAEGTTYVRVINVFPSFDNIPLGVNRPFTEFPADFSRLPRVSIVIPHLFNDMHSDSVQRGDTWLQKNMSAYAQWAMTHRSLLILHWDEDEDEGEDNHIPLVFFGPMVQPGVYASFNNHVHLLRTLEDMFGLSYAGESANVAPITDIWKTSAQGTGLAGFGDRIGPRTSEGVEKRLSPCYR